MIGFMIKTRILNRHLNNFTDTQKNMMFDTQQRAIANMTLNKGCDVENFIERLSGKTQAFDPGYFYEFDSINAAIESL